MPLSPELLEMIVCPACRGPLDAPGEAGLACGGCGRVYPILDGIPVMLVERAMRADSGGDPSST